MSVSQIRCAQVVTENMKSSHPNISVRNYQRKTEFKRTDGEVMTRKMGFVHRGSGKQV